MSERAKNQDKPDRDEPVSLAPLDYETALRALLAVDPESEPVDDGPDRCSEDEGRTSGP